MSLAYPTPWAARPSLPGNRLLASLSAASRDSIESELQSVELKSGTSLHEAGVTPQFVYFPTSVVVSLMSEMQDGRSTEVALIGAEGLVGVCLCMGGAPSRTTAIVQAEGKALRMPAASFVLHTWQRRDLMRPVLRFGEALMGQISQASACNRLHSVDQRLARWLLAMFDRQPGGVIKVTQDRVAASLGVRREGVSTAAFKLQSAGIIRYFRGQVQLLDAARLKACCCECHTVIRSAYDELDDTTRDTSSPPPRSLPASRPEAPFRYAGPGGSQRVSWADRPQSGAQH